MVTLGSVAATRLSWLVSETQRGSQHQGVYLEALPHGAGGVFRLQSNTSTTASDSTSATRPPN